MIVPATAPAVRLHGLMDQLRPVHWAQPAQQMLRAATLDAQVFQAAATDRHRLADALRTVLLVGTLSGAGAAFYVARTGTLSGVPGAFAMQLMATLGAWLLWSFLTYLVATSVFSLDTSLSVLLRVFSLTCVPGVARALLIVPVPDWGGLIEGVALIWSGVAAVVAVRAVLRLGLGEALQTVFLGWLLLHLTSYVLATHGVLPAARYL